MTAHGDDAARQNQIARAGMVIIALNVALTATRAIAGWFSGSTAVVADALNSGTDILATLVVLGGTRIATLPPDPGHPYGHEKAEQVAAKIVGLIITAAGIIAAIGSIRALQRGWEDPVALLAVWVTAGSIAVKELMARFLMRVARRWRSDALAADAANQRTDVLASAAALVGALGSRLGYTALDPAMGILVAGLILRMGLGLYWRSVSALMDPAPPPETMAVLERAVAGTAGVLSVDQIKARRSGASIYVDCKICVDAAITVEQGHRIAGLVKRTVSNAVPEVRDVLVHVNPCVGTRHVAGTAAVGTDLDKT